MTVRDTSMSAYDELRDSGKLSKQQAKVLSYIKPGQDYSIQEMVQITGLEAHIISGRLCDLKNKGALEEAPTRKCRANPTKTIHPVRLPAEQLDLVL